jgi:hypothetical protein
LTTDVYVGSNTLTINPGTLVMVDAGQAGNGTAISVNNGVINAIGTEADPIFMFATNGPTAMSLPQISPNNSLSWGGIDHRGSGLSTYRHIFLTGAGNGVVTGHPRPIILGFFNSHGYDIADCVFADNPGKIIHGGGSGVYTTARSLFSRAGIGGEYFGANHDLLIEDCWFTRNGRAPEANGVDGDALHLDTASTTQLVRRSIIADCGDDAIDHSASFPVIEDMIIWDVRDKAASLAGGGITFDNVLVFDTGIGIRGATGTVIVRNSTIAVGSSVSGTGPVTIDETITTSGFNLGGCSSNINYTLGPNTNHIGCGVGNLSGSPGFQDPGNRDYSLQSSSQAADAGPTGGRIGWLGFPVGALCVNDVDCDDSNACTTDACDAGACVFTPIAQCTPCISDGECDDGDPCTADTCSTGVCINPPGNDGATCDDGFACTNNDVCGSGVCSGSDNCPIGQVCGPADVCIVGQTNFVFQDDGVYTGTEDAHIRQAAPDTTHGTLADNSCDASPCDFFEWDGEDPNPNQNLGLIKFEDITGTGVIPQGSLIESATLTIVISDESFAPGAAIHPLLVDWNESTVTWNNFGADPGVQPGEYGTQVATAPFAVGTHVIDITTAVQGWVDNPATNFGLVIIPDAASTNGVQVRSSEYSVVAERPILTVGLPEPSCSSDIECDDLQFCNGAETCNLSTNLCEFGAPVDCDDSVACTLDSCNEGTDSCDNTPDDVVCDDGNICTNDACDIVSGCQYVDNTDPCDDGSLCTENDVCSGGNCQAGSAVDCSDGVSCTDDSCDSGLGCLNVDNCPGGEICDGILDTCETLPPLPITAGDDWRYLKGTAEPTPGDLTAWTQITFSDLAWSEGPSGIGYDYYAETGGTNGNGDYEPHIGTQLPDMRNCDPIAPPLCNDPGYLSVYMRKAFTVTNPVAVTSLTLQMYADDGYVAYLNGTEVARLRVTGTPPLFDTDVDSGPVGTPPIEATIDLTGSIGLLVPGTNVLAIQGHNADLGSRDFLMIPQLSSTETFICIDDSDCDDLQFCNGIETCDLGTNACLAGTPPNCDDGVDCTTDTCNETSDVCDNSLCPMTATSIGGRYLAITPPAGLSAVALQVDSTAIPCLPQYVDENGLLAAAPVYRTSAEWGTVFVGDREVLPATTYDVAAEVAGPQIVGQDSATTWLWGDANNVDGVELFDILCVQDGFGSIFTACTLEADDVRAGIPDRIIDVDDLMAVLDGVALLPYPDGDPCSGPAPDQWSTGKTDIGSLESAVRYPTVQDPGATATNGPNQSTQNLITLVPSAQRIRSGDLVNVDVFVRETSNLRGYQVALEIAGGSAGLVLAEDAAIATNRDDFAFTGLSSFRVRDVEGVRLGAALGEGGVESYDPIYLGTFAFRATDTAEGFFVIRFVEPRTFLRDDFSAPLEAQLGEDAVIRVVPARERPREVATEGPTDPVD